ncbi:xanthine dehydrogenase small subunit [Pseudorhodoplanes sp.]|uniref:xanthine dehydrogenase small subunit n=1 Tax=Pseudorhodoplanes sp. TaxID=1934341 RepID=UPI003D0C1A39
MSGIQFQLNGRWRTENNVAPTTTLLDYLRLNARLTGTKEGCAEGDCGACTVVIGLPQDDGRIAYRAVNSCLVLVPQVDGLPVITVEGLAQPDGTLHSVQQSLVDADATQCGFCTPGFAMAMFALAQGGEARDDGTIHEALAGNLCRCTGYRPIVEACRTMRADPPGCGLAERVGEAASEYRQGAQLYLAPRSVDELVEAKAKHPDAFVLGGGTDLGIRVSKEREAFPVVISTQWVRELRSISEDSGKLAIGGGVTYTRALPFLDRHFPSFAAMVRRIGSRQIRNIGTLAANIANASPIGDTIPCLMALDASIILRSKRGARSVKADEFIISYRKTAMEKDEIIAAIEIPLLKDGTSFTTYKLSKRFDQDISTVIGAYRLRVDGGKVAELRAAYGGMAATTARATHVEAALVGKPWTAESLRDIDALIAQDFQPMTDHRGTDAYRLKAAANLIRRLRIETTGGQQTGVWQL